VLIQEGREGVLVEDLGSTNGTFLNGQKVDAGHGMVEGDKLRIGTTIFELRVVADEPDLQATAMRSVPDALPDTADPPGPIDTPTPAPTPTPPVPAPVASGLPGGGPGPQAPAPGPQAPAPGPQAPAPGPQAPAPGPQAPAPGPGPQAPAPAGFPPPGPPPAPGGFPPPAAPPAPGGFPPPQAPAYAPPPGGFPPAPAGFGGGPIPQQALAPWFSRVLATIIDGLILLIPFSIIYFGLFAAALGVGSSGSNAGFAAVIVTSLLSMLAFLAVALVYAPYFMKRPGVQNGQTLGKQAMNIRVVRTTGQPIDFGFAALREVAVKILLVGIAGSFTFGLAQLLDYLWPLWDDENRALHDMVVSTRVIKA
jgi:uncharacterized RDD family membrane protein YckC